MTHQLIIIMPVLEIGMLLPPVVFLNLIFTPPTKQGDRLLPVPVLQLLQVVNPVHLHQVVVLVLVVLVLQKVVVAAVQ